MATRSDVAPLCKFYIWGNCNRGEYCRFSHEFTFVHNTESSSGWSETSGDQDETEEDEESEDDYEDEDEDEEEYDDDDDDDEEEVDEEVSEDYDSDSSESSAESFPSHQTTHVSAPAAFRFSGLESGFYYNTPVITPNRTSNTSTTTGAKVIKECMYFKAGYCHRGDTCWFRHEKPAPAASSSAGSSSSGARNNRGTSATIGSRAGSSSKSVNRAEEALVEELEKCSICLEAPTVYGLLASCDHVFCLECLRAWRKKKGLSSDPHESPANSVTKSCPNCRTHSAYIIPSAVIPSSKEEKQVIIASYKQATKKIPCRNFVKSGRRRECFFGNDCFFAHLDENGNPCEATVPHSRGCPFGGNRRNNRHGNDMQAFLQAIGEGSDDDYDTMRLWDPSTLLQQMLAYMDAEQPLSDNEDWLDSDYEDYDD